MTEDDLFILLRKASPQSWHFDRIESKRTVNTILWKGGGFPPIFMNIKCNNHRTFPPAKGGFRDAEKLGIMDIRIANIAVRLICVTRDGVLYMAKIENPADPPKWQSFKSMADIVEVI